MTFTGGTPHKTHVIVATSALIILAVILGFFAYQQNPQLFSWLTQPSQNEATDTATWQTYRNEEYGFEVRHPSQFMVDELRYPRFSEGGVTVRFFSENDLTQFRITIDKHDERFESLESISKAFPGEPLSDVIVAGYPAKFGKSEDTPQSDFGFKVYVYYIQHDQDLIQISFTDPPANQILIDQIIATFRFKK